MDRQPGHFTPARGDASPAGPTPRAPSASPGTPGDGWGEGRGTPSPGTPGERRGEGLLREPNRAAPRRAAAFTLIEILIVVVILGIIAAIVVPQFSNASHVARENMLKDELRYLRTQINVYKAQHGDVPPGYPGGSLASTPTETLFRNQLTTRTNARGESGPASKLYPFGPYLQRIPPNPLTQCDVVKVLQRGQAIPKWNEVSDNDQKTIGWYYKPDTQELAPCSKEKDGRQRPYIEY